MSEYVGKVLQDKYRLTKLLGEGGMASVYEAEHTVIGRKVAVKLLHPRLTDDPTARSRMIREAKVAGSLGHPNVVDVQDVGTTDDGGVYIVMERLEGISLGDLIKAEGQLPVERAVAIVKQLCNGLQAAHDNGTVHRDLKPDNIFLVPTEAGERVKILDFGISKLSSLSEDEGLTRDGLLVGTPHYMAPEHAEGSHHVDHRSDLWSVGVLFYVMLTGELPFAGDNYNAILANVLFKKPPILRELVPEAPEVLEAILSRMLAREPASRYQQATQITADLDRLLHDTGGGTPSLSSAKSHADIAFRSTAPAPAHSSAAESTKVLTAPAGGETEPASIVPVDDGTDDRTEDRTDEKPRISVWEHVVWLAVLLPLSWLVWLPAWRTPAFSHHAFDLDASWGPNLARLVFGGLIVGTTLLAVGINFALRKPLLRRWPLGLWHLLLPATFVGVSFAAWRIFSAQRATQLLAVERYAILDELQAQEIATRIASNQARLCLVLGVIGILVWLLASRVLVRDLFAGTWRLGAPSGHGGADSKGRRTLGGVSIPPLILVGGCLVILVAELVVFPKWLPVIGQLRGQGGTGLHRFLTYLTWLACGIAIVRVRMSGRSDASVTGRAWLVGLVAVAGLTLGSFAVAHARLHDLIGAPPGMRTMADDAVYQLHQANRGSLGGLITYLSLVLVLFTLLRVAAGRLLPKRIGLVSIGRTLLAVCVVVLVVLPLPLPSLASRSLERVYLPYAVSQMHPLSVTPGKRPTVYVDKRPRSLVAARRPFWAALTKRPRSGYHDGALRKVLAGYKHCPVLLARALGRAKKIVPARCISGVEARHYCEALGMRLPTPAEWDAALGKIRLRRSGRDKLPNTPFRRGYFGEWTLHLVHGTSTIAVRGQRGSRRIPAKLEADAFSQFVGFRCAYQSRR